MNDYNDIKRIHTLIERYFEATASEAEERELRTALSRTKLLSPEIEEARAVLGYFVATRHESQSSHSRRPRHFAAAAAIAAIAISAAAIALSDGGRETDNRCIAYVGGTTITDNQRVMSMISADLQTLGDAAGSIENDIESQFSILAEEITL